MYPWPAVYGVSTEMLIEYRLSVNQDINQVLTEMSIERWSWVVQEYWSTINCRGFFNLESIYICLQRESALKIEGNDISLLHAELFNPTMFWLQYSVPAVCLAFFQLTLGKCGKHFHWVSKVGYKTRIK